MLLGSVPPSSLCSLINCVMRVSTLTTSLKVNVNCLLSMLSVKLSSVGLELSEL